MRRLSRRWGRERRSLGGYGRSYNWGHGGDDKLEKWRISGIIEQPAHIGRRSEHLA